MLLYELTTGRRAFFGDNDFAVVGHVLAGEYAPPREVVPGYPAELEAIVSRALATNPDDRFRSAAELGDRLRAFANAQGLDVSRDARAEAMRASCGPVPTPEVDLQMLETAAKAKVASRARTWAFVAGVSATVGLGAFVLGMNQSPNPTKRAVRSPSASSDPAASSDDATAPAEPLASTTRAITSAERDAEEQPRPSTPQDTRPNEAASETAAKDQEQREDPSMEDAVDPPERHRRRAARGGNRPKPDRSKGQAAPHERRSGAAVDPHRLLPPSLRE